MNIEAQKNKWPKSGAVALGVAIATLIFVFRFTAAVALLVVVLLFFLYPLHRNHRLLLAAFALFAAVVLIPIDVYVPGFNGPLVNSKHSGLRFVRVIYGFTAGPTDGTEAILGGCKVGPHASRWRLVWD